MSEPLNISDQIKIAVSLAEGQFREFKSAYAGPPSQKVPRRLNEICVDIAEALVAFANADGGELIVGVEDDGTISGLFDFDADDLQRLKDAPRTHVHKKTPLQSVIVRQADVNGKNILYFRIQKSTKYIHLTSSGRCLQRNDLESIPVPPDQIAFDRKETASREYDRDFIDGASVADLDVDLLKLASEQISPGISTDKCLQYLGLAEYDGYSGLMLRRAALLLFARNPDRWHPRIQVRILRVNGNSLGAGHSYNVASDETIKDNVVRILEEGWEKLRPHLVETRFHEDARFRATYIYPEVACREALVNAIAHRDYADEGAGIEIYVFDDRIEVKNPGSLLSSLSIEDISQLRGVHQSRNSYVARTLRELGIMRELGEGMRRIFELMKTNELAPPELISEAGSFTLTLHHRPMYSRDESLWLDQYEAMSLSTEEKAVVLLGRRGELVSPNNIIQRLGIVDTEHYRQIIHSLQTKGALLTEIKKDKAKAQAGRRGVGIRDVPRFRIVPAVDIAQTQSKSPSSQNKPRPPARSEFSERKALYLGNIPTNTTSRDLVFAVREFGTPVSVRIPLRQGQNRGFAFIEFSDQRTAERLLEAGLRLGPRTLTVRWKEPVVGSVKRGG